jgi:hypothetical protein
LNRILYPLLAGVILLITACASAPPPTLSPSDPASPEGKQAPMKSFDNDLGPDEASQKTHDLIVKQGKRPAASSSDSSSGMSQMPGMNMGGAK